MISNSAPAGMRAALSGVIEHLHAEDAVRHLTASPGDGPTPERPIHVASVH